MCAVMVSQWPSLLRSPLLTTATLCCCCRAPNQADDKPNAKRNPVLLSSESAQHWFRRRLGFKSASSEQQMVWRRDLSEYHKGLIGGCSLLVKAVPLSKAGGGQARSKKA